MLYTCTGNEGYEHLQYSRLVPFKHVHTWASMSFRGSEGLESRELFLTLGKLSLEWMVDGLAQGPTEWTVDRLVQGPTEEVQKQSWGWDPGALDGLHVFPSRVLLGFCVFSIAQLCPGELTASSLGTDSHPCYVFQCPLPPPVSPAHLVLFSLSTSPPSCQSPFITCWPPWSQNLSLSVEA